MSNTTKLLGAWGGLASLVLGVLGFLIPGGHLVALAGTICLIVAYYRAAGEMQRPAISSSMTIALVLMVVGSIVGAMVFGAALIGLFHGGSLSTLGAGLGVGAMGGWLLSYVLSIAASWFWYKAASEVAAGSGISLFKTAGLIYFIGVITLVLFGLGGLLMLVGAIMQIVAFFSVPDQRAAGTLAT